MSIICDRDCLFFCKRAVNIKSYSIYYRDMTCVWKRANQFKETDIPLKMIRGRKNLDICTYSKTAVMLILVFRNVVHNQSMNINKSESKNTTDQEKKFASWAYKNSISYLQNVFVCPISKLGHTPESTCVCVLIVDCKWDREESRCDVVVIDNDVVVEYCRVYRCPSCC